MAETQVPFAAGKAAALSSYLSRGGAISKKGTYTKGKMKGKSPEEVTAAFETLWANVDGSIKDKYAKRASPEGALSPSEQKSMGKEKMRQMGKDFRPETATMPAMKTVTNPSATTESDGKKSSRGANPTGPSGANPRGPRGGAPKSDDDDEYTAPTTPVGTRNRDQSTASNGPGKPISAGFAPGSDEARAAALTENSANERYATAGRGNDVADRAIAAAAQEADAKTEAERTAARAAEINAEKTQPRTTSSTAPALGRPATTASPTSPTTPLPGGYRPIGSRAEDIAAAGNDPTKLPTDSRMVVQDKVNGGSTPVVKAPPGPREGKPMPAAPAIAPQVSALREAPDFTAGPGKELTGMSGGRPTYTSADSLYGKAKPSISNTIKNTPATADPKKPVMIEGQSMEQRRADYQNRSQPSEAVRDSMQNQMELDGTIPMTNRSARKPTGLPRGPASQPQKTGSSLDNPNSAFSDAAYQRTADAQAEGVRRQAEEANKPTMGDVDRAFKPGTPEHTAAAWGVNSKTGAQLTKDDTKDTAPTSSRVVSSRPATAQESKDGKAREIPAIQPTPEPSAKSKPKFARR